LKQYAAVLFSPEAMLAIFSIFFLFLNLFAAVGAGIWLAILGEWQILLWGIGLTIFGAFIVSLLLAPSLLLVAPIAANPNLARSTVALAFLTTFSTLYTYCVMGVWAICIFYYFANASRASSALPTVLWSYAVATGVWSYMAQKEAQSGNQYSALSAFFNQISCVVLMVYSYANYRDLELVEMAVWYAIPMAIALAINVLMAISLSRQQM
jgi:hypothetical protein